MEKFLPDDYQSPKASGRYTRLQDGDNIRLRILTSPVMFWEFWSQDNKPIRYAYAPGAIVSAPANAKDHKGKFVWAVVIYNYSTKQTEVWSISQVSIRKSLEEYIKDEDIGNPKNYDIKVSRSGSGMETGYPITPLLKNENTQAMSKDILDEAAKINLKALITNDNPFEATQFVYTNVDPFS